MTTATPKPVIHVFKEINEGKYTSVKHYELKGVKNGYTLLSNYVNISKDRMCAKSSPDYWLKIKVGKKWSSCLTGLFKIGIANIYKGDTQRRRNLLVFKFSDNASKLTIYFFQNYFTKDLNNILHLIRKLQETKKRGV
jgi:hypothetical protein